MKVGEVAARSYLFDLGIQWCDLSLRDKRACKYTMQHIHKLPFDVPPNLKAYKLYALEGIVMTFHRKVKQSEDLVIAYKGGHFERIC